MQETKTQYDAMWKAGKTPGSQQIMIPYILYKRENGLTVGTTLLCRISQDENKLFTWEITIGGKTYGNKEESSTAEDAQKAILARLESMHEEGILK